MVPVLRRRRTCRPSIIAQNFHSLPPLPSTAAEEPSDEIQWWTQLNGTKDESLLDTEDEAAGLIGEVALQTADITVYVPVELRVDSLSRGVVRELDCRDGKYVARDAIAK